MLLSLIHSRQIIVTKASLLNGVFFSRCFVEDSFKNEKECIKKLLANGTIVVFLYGKHEISPFVHKMPSYSTTKSSIEAWNKICSEISIYCIRENWNNPVDMNSIKLLQFGTSIAMDKEVSTLVAKNLHISNLELRDFLITIKNIEMQIFCQTHMNGVGNLDRVDGYSRSRFYKNFIVKEKAEIDSVLNCLFDTKENKPFNRQLKKWIDIFYNSIFANYFKCLSLLPNDICPEDVYINRLYLKHGEKEVSVDELAYAFSEFFENCNILKEIENIGSDIYLSDWSLEKVVELRKKNEWYEYIELL